MPCIKLVKKTLLLVSFLLLSNKTLATDLTVLESEQDFFADFSITSATRLAQSPRDLPVSVTIITREMIDASGATEIPDLFRMVPGFRVVINDGGFYSVFGHGSSDHWGRKLQVLIDGLPVQSPVLNFVDWLSLPVELSDIDSIEIMRGTSAAVYGTNAFDGVINIITRKPFEEKGLFSQLTTGTQNTRRGLIKYGFNSKNSYHTFTFSKKQNNGFDNVHDSSKNTKFRYKGSFSTTLKDELDTLISFNSGYKDINGIGNGQRTRDMESNHQYINWKHHYTSSDNIELKAYHYAVDYDDEYKLGLLSELYNISPATVPTVFNGHADQQISYGSYTAKSDRYGLEIQRIAHYEELRFVIGAGLIYDTIKSRYLFGDKGKVSGLNKQIFSNAEWRIDPDLVMTAGLMVEKIEDRDEEISRKLSINYHYNRFNSFRLGAARSYRARTVYSAGVQLVMRYVDDGQIFNTILDNQGYTTPEIVTTYEFAHMLNLPESRLSLDWRLFRDEYDDFRAVINDSSYQDDAKNGAKVNINGGNYYVEGYELQIKYKHDDKKFITAQYSRTKSRGLIANNLNATSFEDFSDAMPEEGYGIMIGTDITSHIDLGLTYSKTGGSKWRTLGDTLPGYKRLDANLSSHFKTAGNDIKVEFLIQNLLNEPYNEYNVNNLFSRRFFLRLSLKY